MGQTMITSAFFVLLIASAINANRLIMESTQSTYEADATNLAVDIARSVITEAYKKKFDDRYVDSVYQVPSDFTAPSSLGPSISEVFTPSPDRVPYQSPSRFDDVDDYHGYTRTVDAADIKGFIVTVEVYYIDPSTYVRTTVQTYLKRINVSVEHPVYLKTKATYSSVVTL